MKILVDYPGLNSLSNKITKIKEEINTLIADIEKLRVDVDNAWDGDASRQFLSKLDDRIAKLKVTPANLSLLSRMIDGSLGKFKAIEDDCFVNLKKEVDYYE